MNPNHFIPFVRLLGDAVSMASQFPLGEYVSRKKPSIPLGARKALFWAPHPDDECIMGALLLRMYQEMLMRAINVAVTLGSNKDRQVARLAELREACDFIGFELLPMGLPNGLEKVTFQTRTNDPGAWGRMVGEVVKILTEEQPHTIFFPHVEDANGTHIGVHHLLMDALAKMPREFECFVVETEFWRPMAKPNLMVEVGEKDLADMIAALTCHKGEVERNPYHLTLVAWMMDNVRRGAELVGVQGGKAPDFLFATLYRLVKWSAGSIAPFYEGGRILTKEDNPETLFTL